MVKTRQGSRAVTHRESDPKKRGTCNIPRLYRKYIGHDAFRTQDFLYERLKFRITSEDEYKVYMRAGD